MWGAQTPMGLYLQENDITTLFFGGVNADQCVVSLLLINRVTSSSMTFVMIDL